MKKSSRKNRIWFARFTALLLAVTFVLSSSDFSNAEEASYEEEALIIEEADPGEELLPETDTIPEAEVIPAENGFDEAPDMPPAGMTTAEEIPLAGIRLDKRSIMMRTGEEAVLTLSFVPEDATDPGHVTWASDDPDVCQVTGNETTATLYAPMGSGGSARITATVGEYSVSCQVLVIVRGPMLESIQFMGNSSGSIKYELKETGEGEFDYTLRIPETRNAVFVRPQLEDDVDGSAEIIAEFTDVDGVERSIGLGADENTSLSNPTTGRLINAYDTAKRELTITVRTDDREEVYYYHIIRGTYADALTVTDADGEPVSYTPEFNKDVFSYRISVPDSMEEVSISFKPYVRTNTVLLADGVEVPDGNYTADLTDGRKEIVFSAGDGGEAVPYEYVIHIDRYEVCRLTVVTDPADALFSIYDRNQIQVYPKDGVYELVRDADYTYTVTCTGYVTLSGSFTAEADEERSFVLLEASETELTEYETAWGGYWKTDANMNITDDPVPAVPQEAEVLWAKQYGTSQDALDSVSDAVFVGDRLLCFSGKTLMYLNKNTGEVEQSTQMITNGLSEFCKPLYAAGMIFVPLSNGRIQAFNAETLESLWIYSDAVGGASSVALRYDSGYLYAGFYGGNLVCISVTDEDPYSTNEDKKASWRRYDSGGFYRTGTYISDRYIYAGSRSGILYCLDKTTGLARQKITLDADFGAVSTAVCFSDGRIYFGTEKGYLVSYALGEGGAVVTDSLATFKAGSVISGTPLIRDHRIYVATGTKNEYGVLGKPYYIHVLSEDPESGAITSVYSMETAALAKGTPTMTTAYAGSDGTVCVYFTTDSANGSIYLLKDRPDAEEPLDGSGLFFRQKDCVGNGSASILTDSSGQMYFHYDSAYLYALHGNGAYLSGAACDDPLSVMDDGDAFDPQAKRHAFVLDSSVSTVCMTFTPCGGGEVSVDGVPGETAQITVGSEPVTVTVEVTKGEESREYVFSVRKRSNDTSLAELRVSYMELMDNMPMEVVPAYSPDVTEYRASIFQSLIQPYYVWPLLPENSGSVLRVTAVSNCCYKNSSEVMLEGTSIEYVPITLPDGQERNRYLVTPKDGGDTVIKLTVTAEDGRTTKSYLLTLCQDNTRPDLKLNADPLVLRGEDRIKVSVTSNIDGYIYYIPRLMRDAGETPQSSDFVDYGIKLPLTGGENVLELTGISSKESVVYMQSVSYAQRRSTVIRLDVPEYQPVVKPEIPEGSGDINGDGAIGDADVQALLDAVTGGESLPADLADINGDGNVDNADVLTLLDYVMY